MPSWNSTYREHAPGIRAFLRRRLRSTEAAEDMTQETFVRAMGAGDRLRNPSRVKSYLYRIASNLVVNQKRRPEVERTEADLGDDADLDTMAESGFVGPEQALHANELHRRLDAVLSSLSEEHALAFRWGVIERMPYAEIRERTGWSASKVKINVFRARKRVVEELSDLRPDRSGD